METWQKSLPNSFVNNTLQTLQKAMYYVIKIGLQKKAMQQELLITSWSIYMHCLSLLSSKNITSMKTLVLTKH